MGRVRSQNEPRHPPDTVLGKVMVVLHAFGVDDHGVGFAELQRRTGLAKGTLHRLLGELEVERLLDRIDGRYHLGGHLFELGMRASVERGLIEVATPFLEDLYERTHEIVHLGLREGSEVVYVAKVGGHQQARTPSRLGGRMPLHATAIGKALLAHAPDELRTSVFSAGLSRLTPRTITAAGLLGKQLDAIVENGVAYEFEESAVGLVCVASAVLGRDDEVLAAVSVSGPITRFRPQQHAASVHAAAAGIAATLARREAFRENAP
jgi:DNA-binding IclR family transcriptional regulator